MKLSFSTTVWALAWPIILSNLSIPLLGMVDTAVVGHLPQPDAIATVALGSMIFDVLFWCFGFLRMSTTALAAKESGNHQIYYQSSVIAVILGLLLIFLSPFLKHATLYIIQTTQAVEMLLGVYFDIRILSAIPTLINYVNYGFFFGRQNTKTPLLLLLFTNGLAMLLDYLLVWQLHLAANGIAFANLITQTVGASLGVWLIYQKYLRHAPKTSKPLFSLKRAKALFQLNRDIFIRTLFLVLTTAFFTRQSAALGVTVVAANMILMHFQLLASYALDGFAIAAETLIGRAIGEKNPKAFSAQLNACAKWSVLFGTVLMLLYAVLGPLIIKLLTSLPEVTTQAMQSLPWVIILPLLSVPGFLLDGVFIGATWSKPLRNSILFASLFVFFPIWYLSTPLLNQGLWLAYTAFICARGIYLFISLSSTVQQGST